MFKFESIGQIDNVMHAVRMYDAGVPMFVQNLVCDVLKDYKDAGFDGAHVRWERCEEKDSVSLEVKSFKMAVAPADYTIGPGDTIVPGKGGVAGNG